MTVSPSSRRIGAFIGRSFQPEDEPVWQEVEKILNALTPLGFVFEDARIRQPRPVSEKVREGIERNEIYIGILTRRAPIEAFVGNISFGRRFLAVCRGQSLATSWATSSWVIQESGFALGRSKKLLLIVENGVDFPLTDLAADAEKIPFDRRSIAEHALDLWFK